MMTRRRRRRRRRREGETLAKQLTKYKRMNKGSITEFDRYCFWGRGF